MLTSPRNKRELGEGVLRGCRCAIKLSYRHRREAGSPSRWRGTAVPIFFPLMVSSCAHPDGRQSSTVLGLFFHSFAASLAAVVAPSKSRCDRSIRTSSMANIVCWARCMSRLPGSAPDSTISLRYPARSVTIDSACRPLPRCRCTMRSRMLAVTSEEFSSVGSPFATARA